VDPLTHADHGAAQNLWVDVEGRKHLLAELAAKGSLDVALKRLVRRPGERDTGADPIVLDIEQRLDEQRELVGGGLERLAQELGLLGRYQREAEPIESYLSALESSGIAMPGSFSQPADTTR